MTANDLKQVTSGMQRNEVLKLGEPTSRISMVDEGHLLEIYRYQSKDSTLGVVHLTDGAVSTVLIRIMWGRHVAQAFSLLCRDFRVADPFRTSRHFFSTWRTHSACRVDIAVS